MQAKSVEFSRPERHPMLSQAVIPAAMVAPCGVQLVASFTPHPVVLCGCADVIGRREGDWSTLAGETDRCASRDRLRDAGELQEPVDLSLHIRDVSQSSSSTAGRQQPADLHGRSAKKNS